MKPSTSMHWLQALRTLPSRRGFEGVAVAAFTCAVYAYALGGEFVSDDWPMIAENPHLASAASLPGFFTRGLWASSALELTTHKMYRPLYLLWYFAIHAVAGPSAFAYHLALLLMHVWNALLVHRLIDRLVPGASGFTRIAGALVFALHPAQTQAVAWISGGTDPVLAVLVLSGLLAYLQFREGGSRWGGRTAIACFAAALLVKETAIVFPLLLLAWDATQPATRRRPPWVLYAAMAWVLGAYLFLRSQVLDPSELALSARGGMRLAEQTLLFVRYALVPWPFPFHFSYPAGGLAGPVDAAIGAIGLAAFVGAFRHPSMRFALLLAALPAAPTLGLSFHPTGVFALRFLYLPLVGVALLAACALHRLERRRSVSTRAVAAPVLIGYIALSFVAMGDWRDEGTFFRKVVQTDPLSSSGYVGLGGHHTRRGEIDEAVAAYRRGIDRIPDPHQRVKCHRKLALLLADHGRYEEALAAFEAMRFPPYEAEALGGMGNCLWMLGRNREALETYRRVLVLDPNDFHALYNYARLSESLGHLEDARQAYARLVTLPTGKADPAALAHAREFLAKHKRRGQVLKY